MKVENLWKWRLALMASIIAIISTTPIIFGIEFNPNCIVGMFYAIGPTQCPRSYILSPYIGDLIIIFCLYVPATIGIIMSLFTASRVKRQIPVGRGVKLIAKGCGFWYMFYPCLFLYFLFSWGEICIGIFATIPVAVCYLFLTLECPRCKAADFHLL